MKLFSYFLLTIFFAILTVLSFAFLDPGMRGNLNTANILIVSTSILITITSLYFFINIIFTKKMNLFIFIRGIIVGLMASGLFILNIFSLLTWISLGIICIIYLLIETILLEAQKK